MYIGLKPSFKVLYEVNKFLYEIHLSYNLLWF